MNFFEKIIWALDGNMSEPPMFGWFHLLTIGLIIALTVVLCWRLRNCSKKTFNIIILVAWIVMVLFEIYKQLNYSFNWDGTNAVWDYQWYAFPFQLCSSPLFVFPFIFCGGGKKESSFVRDGAMAFSGTFSLFGGLVSILYPVQILTTNTGVNIQTVVHHGLQIVIGIFILVHERHRLNFRFFLKGLLVFVFMSAVAMGLNLLGPTFTNETFNMYYISPYFPCTLPLLGDLIWPNVPYVVFLLIYFLGFALIGLAIYYIQYGLIKLCMRPRNKKV